MAIETSILKHLQNKGLIDEEKARQVLVERSRTQKTEDAIIRELGLVSDNDLAKAKDRKSVV